MQALAVDACFMCVAICVEKTCSSIMLHFCLVYKVHKGISFLINFCHGYVMLS